MVSGWTGFDSREAGFKELWELYQYVKENVDPDAIVIDAADMISDPCEVSFIFKCLTCSVKSYQQQNVPVLSSTIQILS